jgi:hypothetical protein
MAKDVYTQSNAITEVALSRFRKGEYSRLLDCGVARVERERAGQDLLDYLCDKFGIARVRLHVTEQAQKCRKSVRGNVKTLGFYCVTRDITIYNTTAKIGKVVSIKVFAETLLHEFAHHYDHYYLHFPTSPHTSGFYHRIGDLQGKLK